MKDWNNHWSGYKYDGLSASKNPKEWADVSWFTSLAILSFEIEQFLEKTKIDPCKIKFLEVGCGSAVVSRFVLDKYKFNVYAIDSSEIAVLNIKKEALGVNLSVGDLMKLDFDNGFFHIIYSGGVLEYIGDLDSAFNELHRVIDVNGIILANIVPRIFNVQILGDILFRLKSLGNSSSPSRMVPNAASSKRPKEYSIFFQKYFSSSRIIYYLPFPEFPSPIIIRRIYGKIIFKCSLLLIKLIPKYFNLNSYLSVSALFVLSAKRSDDV
jgi:ubiquinone/menaquinone biosynthesis C-methylase UbiE